jgi:hypothetical protein
MLKLIIAAALLGVAHSKCANSCSGHGSCGTNDKCTCYANWQDNDCSQRTCPYGKAWVDTAKTSDSAHNYAECSNRGTCDRKTGLCSCEDGYSGMGCGRQACPNDCSGHGTCETMAELAMTASTTYSAWDSMKARACKCDAKWTGHDCSGRMCPKGDDPLTSEVDVTQASTTSLQVNEVQNVTVQAVSANMNSGEVTFTYTDLYNGQWTTRPVELPLVKTWSNKNGYLQTPGGFRWIDTGSSGVTMATAYAVDADGVKYVTHTAAGMTATERAHLKKGDWVLFSSSTVQEGLEWCTGRLYDDVYEGWTDIASTSPPTSCQTPPPAPRWPSSRSNTAPTTASASSPRPPRSSCTAPGRRSPWACR